ncbi:MAG: helix-turn-helix domain-containing protein [Crocinitomicaceae bacterium]|nr:helix-turn-helix domain-containing protein [Crocinitomicaceae bacterium]
MEISIVTQQDLQELKSTLLEKLTELQEVLIENQASKTPEVELLKSHQVQRMLGISAGTLQNMRVNGTLPFSKVGGVIFYNKKEILDIIEDNKQNG